MMASRWAFEAAMVAQFKDNLFERQFYMHDKAMANADYRKVYYIPELETRLQFCLNNFKSSMPDTRSKVESDLTLIKKEVQSQLDYTGQTLPALDKLSIQHFDFGRL
ncbi:MAG: hypothetical protein QM762_11370 [Chryseolinea sp.]